MALLGAHRLRTIDQPARPHALAAGRPVVEQTKPLRPPMASRANEQRPRCATRKRLRRHADLVLDPAVVEPNERRLRLRPNVALRPQCRGLDHRQIVDRELHVRKNYRHWTHVSRLLGIPFASFGTVSNDGRSSPQCRICGASGRATFAVVNLSWCAHERGVARLLTRHVAVDPTATRAIGGRRGCLVFWRFWQWVPGARLKFRRGGARRRVSEVRPWVCGIYVIELTRQNPRGGFGLYGPPPPKRPISLTGFDVERGRCGSRPWTPQLGGMRTKDGSPWERPEPAPLPPSAATHHDRLLSATR